MVERYRHYQPSRTPPTRRTQKKRRKLAFLLVIIVLIGGFFTMRDSGGEQSNQEPKPAAKKKAVVKAEPISDATWQQLETVVNQKLAEHAGIDIGVSVIDVKTGTKVNYGYQEPFHGASTTKILTAAAFLEQVEAGTYTLDQQIGSFSAREHLRQMINRSNNASWAVLNSAVGFAELDAYAKEQGINSFKYAGNLMSAEDMALLLYKLHTKKLLGEEHTQLILSYMQSTNNEDMIPVVTPEGGTLYHKYGQLDDRLHDAAVLEHKDRPMVLVIYTKAQAGQDTGYNARIALIQQIAASVFETFYANK